MNLQQARVALRPRDLPQIFDLSLRFCTAVAGRLFLRLCALTLLLGLAVCYAVHLGTDGDWRWTWAAAATIAAVTRGLFTVGASRALFEAQPRVGSVSWQYLRRLPALLVALTLYGLLLAVSVIGVIVPLLVAGLYSFLAEAVLLEQVGPVRALGRARSLLRMRFDAGLALRAGQLAAAALFIVVVDQLGQALVAFVLQLGHPFGQLREGGSGFAVAGLLLSTPYLAAAEFLTYIDARTRQDGWDIQLRFLAIAGAEEAE